MNWLERSKNHEIPQAPATKPTKPGSVGFVAPMLGDFENPSLPEAVRAAPAANETPEQLVPDEVRTCAKCHHQTALKTCWQPAAAGLVDSYDLVFFDQTSAGHAAGCAASYVKAGEPARDAPERPYLLSVDQINADHATCCEDEIVDRFLARVSYIRSRGFSEQDAEDLAEGLHLRDVIEDDRVMCL